MAAIYTPQTIKYFGMLGNQGKAAAASAGTLGPLGEAQYNTAKSNAQLQYGQGIAQNAYQRGQAQAQYGDQRSGLIRQFGQLRERLPYASNAMGMLGSGVWHRQLNKALGDQQYNLGILRRQEAGALGGYDLMRTQLEQTRSNALANLIAQRTGGLQQIALNKKPIGM